MLDVIQLETEVLIAGGGGAGMFAAHAAANNGAQVILLDKNIIGRGRATIMVQMTCAAALGEINQITAPVITPRQRLFLSAKQIVSNMLILITLIRESFPPAMRRKEMIVKFGQTMASIT